MSNAANFSGDEFKRTAFEFKNEKESRFLDFAPSRKRETKTFMVVQLRPKKCKKKSVLHVQSCWCLFSLPSPSSLVKLPSNTDQTQHRQQLNEPISRQKVSSAGESLEWKLRLGLVLFWLAEKVARDLRANHKAWHRSISAIIFVEILLSRN